MRPSAGAGPHSDLGPRSSPSKAFALLHRAPGAECSFRIQKTLTCLRAAGCTYRLGDFTALSSKNVPLAYDRPYSATAKVCKVASILFFYLGPPSLEDAVDQAIADRGNALVNQVTYTSNYTFLLGTYQCFEVKGDVVTIK